MELQTHRWCASNSSWECPIGNYIVRWGKASPHHAYAMAYTCTCAGFKYRKTCRHIALAEMQHCKYGWEAAAGSPIPMGDDCPKCGGPTEPVKIVV